MKSARPYTNLMDENTGLEWQVLPDTDGLVSFALLTEDRETGAFSRVTKFCAGANTSKAGTVSHVFCEEIIVLSGRLYDAAQKIWLTAGHYACRSPGEAHGPFSAAEDCYVIDVSHVQKIADK